MKRAIFPGTFDPITIGHVEIINRALPLFDEIIIAIGRNTDKKHLFDMDKRIGWIKEIFKDEPKVTADHYNGLTVDFCKFKEAKYILRGLRSVTDYDYEYQIAQINKSLWPELETVFLLSMPENTAISSKMVRDVILYGGDYKRFVPDAVRIG
ncbi:MAG: pantetheine-phosphate adenylyltransferase [Bacteroidetes bacterium]|nr:MAG: pantetheine-phosphate adenylyltransferase [Bacteroidota bacterium]